MLYATVASLRAYLDQVDVTAATDEVLAAILGRASATVRTTLRSLLADPTFDFADEYAAASTRIITAYGGHVLPIPPHLAGSVTEVEYEAGTNPTTWTAIADEWYEQGDGSLYRPYGWGIPYRRPLAIRYQVTARWGYGPVPDEIEQVTLELAVNMWRSKDKGGFTDVVGVEGRGSIRAVAHLTSGQKAVLEAWAAPIRGLAL